MSLTLDRMALEDVGAEPQRVAEAILAQMEYRSGPVPIEEIAFALGIVEIREEPLTNLEGTLITTPERDSGVILVNSNASPRRRRFTVGHELGHFLNPYHVGADEGGLSCSLGDMRPGPRPLPTGIAARKPRPIASRSRYWRRAFAAGRFSTAIRTSLRFLPWRSNLTSAGKPRLVGLSIFMTMRSPSCSRRNGVCSIRFVPGAFPLFRLIRVISCHCLLNPRTPARPPIWDMSTRASGCIARMASSCCRHCFRRRGTRCRCCGSSLMMRKSPEIDDTHTSALQNSARGNRPGAGPPRCRRGFSDHKSSRPILELIVASQRGPFCLTIQAGKAPPALDFPSTKSVAVAVLPPAIAGLRQ